MYSLERENLAYAYQILQESGSSNIYVLLRKITGRLELNNNSILSHTHLFSREEKQTHKKKVFLMIFNIRNTNNKLNTVKIIK